MNEVISCTVLRHTIFKCIRDLDKYSHADIPRVGEFNTNQLHGLVPRFIPKADSVSIILDGGDVIYGRVKWPIKNGELFLTDLTFEVSPRAVDTEEIMEFLLIAVVRVIRNFELKVNAL